MLADNDVDGKENEDCVTELSKILYAIWGIF